MGANALKNVIRNDSLTVTATITDTNKNPVNIDGYVGYCTVKAALNNTSNVNDDPGLAQVKIDSISDPLGTGVVSFTFLPTNTNIIPGNYFYDISVIAPNGSIYSSIADTFQVIADTTRATS